MQVQHVAEYYRAKLLAGINLQTIEGRDIGDKYALYAALAVNIYHARLLGLA